MFTESNTAAVYLHLANMQVEKEVNREHDGEDIVLPGESGYSGNSGWENLEEDIEEEESDRQVGGGAEVHGRDSSGEGNEYHGGNVVTPRHKRARLELEKDMEAALEDDGGDEDDHDEGFGFWK